MRKRIADWCEKMSVASFAIGIYQANVFGIFIGSVTFLMSIYLTYKEQQNVRY